MIKILLFNIFCVFYVSLSVAQSMPVKQEEIKLSAVKDIEAVNSTFFNKEKYNCKIIYNKFSDHHSKVIELSDSGYYRKNGKLIHSYIMGIESYVDTEYKIDIDHENKSMIISNAVASTPIGDWNISKVIALCENIYFTKSADKNHIYKLTFNDQSGDFSVIEITIDPRLKILKKLIVYFNEQSDHTNIYGVTKPRVEILYHGFSFNPVFASKEFQLSEYVLIKNTDMAPAIKYKSFRLYNHYKFPAKK